MSKAAREARETRHRKFKEYADVKKTQGDKPKNMTAAAKKMMTLLAEKKFAEDPESGVRADINQQKFSEKLARDLVLEPHIQLSVDPNRKGVEEMWKHMTDINYAEGELDFSKVIDTSLYLEALQELSRESPDPFWDKLEERFKEQNQ